MTALCASDIICHDKSSELIGNAPMVQHLALNPSAEGVSGFGRKTLVPKKHDAGLVIVNHWLSNPVVSSCKMVVPIVPLFTLHHDQAVPMILLTIPSKMQWCTDRYHRLSSSGRVTTYLEPTGDFSYSPVYVAFKVAGTSTPHRHP